MISNRDYLCWWGDNWTLDIDITDVMLPDSELLEFQNQMKDKYEEIRTLFNSLIGLPHTPKLQQIMESWLAEYLKDNFKLNLNFDITCPGGILIRIRAGG